LTKPTWTKQRSIHSKQLAVRVCDSVEVIAHYTSQPVYAMMTHDGQEEIYKEGWQALQTSQATRGMATDR